MDASNASNASSATTGKSSPASEASDETSNEASNVPPASEVTKAITLNAARAVRLGCDAELQKEQVALSALHSKLAQTLVESATVVSAIDLLQKQLVVGKAQLEAHHVEQRSMADVRILELRRHETLCAEVDASEAEMRSSCAAALRRVHALRINQKKAEEEVATARTCLDAAKADADAARGEAGAAWEEADAARSCRDTAKEEEKKLRKAAATATRVAAAELKKIGEADALLAQSAAHLATAMADADANEERAVEALGRSKTALECSKAAQECSKAAQEQTRQALELAEDAKVRANVAQARAKEAHELANIALADCAAAQGKRATAAANAEANRRATQAILASREALVANLVDARASCEQLSAEIARVLARRAGLEQALTAIKCSEAWLQRGVELANLSSKTD